ncbi:MAG: glycosyltransferase family 2 protein [Solobacterium sp.]|nr:glycosyltransferase family 2 protein [Solobacterium sp.]MBR0479325.1 glycosyltransferase family 2 protein [Solobacterium sp.]
MSVSASTISISVIIPVYNTEECLSRCLDSVLHQSMRNIEILCINDGSTDHSLQILESYAEQDNRVRVYSQLNQGAGAARNEGIRHASGKYIQFTDSDDFMDSRMLEVLFRRAEETSADIVQSRFRRCNPETGQYGTPDGLKINVLKGHPVFSADDFGGIVTDICTPGPCTNLYSTAFLNETQIRFPETRNTEDAFFVFMSVLLAERISWIKNAFYSYRDRDESLHKTVYQHPLAFIEVEESILQDLHRRQLWPAAQKAFTVNSVNNCYYGLRRLYSSPGAMAAALNRLIFGYFPETKILESPESWYARHDDYLLLKDMYMRALAFKDSSEWIHVPDMSHEEENLFNMERFAMDHIIRDLEEKKDNLKTTNTYRTAEFIARVPRKIKDAFKQKEH